MVITMAYKDQIMLSPLFWPNLFLISPLLILFRIPWLLIQHAMFTPRLCACCSLSLECFFLKWWCHVSLFYPFRFLLICQWSVPWAPYLKLTSTPIIPHPHPLSYLLIYCYCLLSNGVRDFFIFYSLLFPRFTATNIG